MCQPGPTSVLPELIVLEGTAKFSHRSWWWWQRDGGNGTVVVFRHLFATTSSPGSDAGGASDRDGFSVISRTFLHSPKGSRRRRLPARPPVQPASAALWVGPVVLGINFQIITFEWWLAGSWKGGLTATCSTQNRQQRQKPNQPTGAQV